MDRVDRIVLELRRDAVPISGVVRADAGVPLPFIGWTGLFTVLQEMVGGAMAVPTPPDEESLP